MAYFSQEMKAQMQPAIKACLKKYGVKGSLSVKDYMKVILKITEGSIDFMGCYAHETHWGRPIGDKKPDYLQLSNYSDLSCFKDDKARECLKELISILNKGNHNNSDAQTDYHDVGWYVALNIGAWNKPYILSIK